MKNYMDKCAVCPFYSQEEPMKLHCEGYSVGTRFHIIFDCKERKKAHKKKYCNNMDGYADCPLYPAIYEQYREDDDE